jgi:hypothetical protein
MTYAWGIPVPTADTQDEADTFTAQAICQLIAEEGVGAVIEQALSIPVGDALNWIGVKVSPLGRFLGGLTFELLTSIPTVGSEGYSKIALVRDGSPAGTVLEANTPYTVNCLIDGGDVLFSPTAVYIEKSTGWWSWDPAASYPLVTPAEVAAQLNTGWLILKQQVTITEPGRYRLGCGLLHEGRVEKLEVDVVPHEAWVPPISSPFVLSNPGANPVAASSSESYFFYVDYYDADGTSPTTKRLTIDGTFTADVEVLQSGSASHGRYVYGPVALEAGQHHFSFHFENGVDPAIDTPTVNEPYVYTPVSPGGGQRIQINAAPNPVSENTCTVLIATLTDGNGRALTGQTLTLSTDFPGALHGYPPLGCTGPSYEAGTSGTTDAQGQVRKYFKPSTGGVAVLLVETAEGTAATTTLNVNGLQGDVSGSLYVISANPGSSYRIEGSLTKGGQPLTSKLVTLTTSQGVFYHNNVSYGSTYTDYTDGIGEFGQSAGNYIELHFSGYTGFVVVTLVYPGESYHSATTFLCSSSTTSDQLKLFPRRRLNTGYSLYDVAWSPNGAQLFAVPNIGTSTGHNALYSWYTADWSQAFIKNDLRHYGLSTAVKADGTMVAVGESGGGIEIFDMSGTRVVLSDESGDVQGVDWVGAKVVALVEASGSTADDIKTQAATWFTTSGTYSPFLTFDPAGWDAPNTNIRYDPVYQRVAYGMEDDSGNSTIHLHNAISPSTYRTKVLFSDGKELESVDFSASGNLLAVGGQFTGPILINTADLSTFQIVGSESFHRVAFLKSQNLVAAASRTTGMLKVYDLTGREVFSAVQVAGVRGLAWNDATQQLALGLWNGEVVIYGFDVLAPVVASATVEPGTYHRGTVFAISATITDADSGVRDASVAAVVRDPAGMVVARIPLVRTSGDTFASAWDSSGAAATTYSVGVYAEDMTGNAVEVNPISLLSFLETINAPSLISVAATSPTEVSVAWLDGSSNEAGFRVERSANGTAWAVATTTAPNASGYVDAGLQPGTWYYYRVVAFNSVAHAVSTPGAAFTPALDDTSGPFAEVTSGASGTVVRNALFTVAGTASDAGLGDNGVSSVAVNGSRAYSDTAIGSGQANWHATVRLDPGINELTIIASDGSDRRNSTFVTFTVEYEASLVVPADFTGDVKSDVLWRHTGSGAMYLWPMNGASPQPESYVGGVGPDWQIRSIADFTGDGQADLLWRHAGSGAMYLWPMQNGIPQPEAYVGTVPLTYEIVASGDFDGDQKADLLWRHVSQGDMWLWRLNGAVLLGDPDYVDTVPPAYEVRGTGDLDGNGTTDVVWQHTTGGDVWAWLMNGAAHQVDYVATVWDPGYQVKAVGDFTGDTKADILWHHVTQGTVYLWEMNGLKREKETWVTTVWDVNYQIAAFGDYDGDARTDLVWRHIVNGDALVWLMDGAQMRSETPIGTVPIGYQLVR